MNGEILRLFKLEVWRRQPYLVHVEKNSTNVPLENLCSNSCLPVHAHIAEASAA